jgi:hypothetical protein
VNFRRQQRHRADNFENVRDSLRSLDGVGESNDPAVEFAATKKHSHPAAPRNFGCQLRWNGIVKRPIEMQQRRLHGNLSVWQIHRQSVLDATDEMNPRL